MEMKYEWRKYLDEMRRDGYAVVVFSPEELDGADPRLVEKLLTGEFDLPQEPEEVL